MFDYPKMYLSKTYVFYRNTNTLKQTKDVTVNGGILSSTHKLRMQVYGRHIVKVHLV